MQDHVIINHAVNRPIERGAYFEELIAGGHM